MSDPVERALALWSQPVPAGDDGLTAFRTLYTDPVVINGAATAVSVLVERARMLQRAVDGLTHHLDVVVETPGRVAFAFRITGHLIGPLATPLGVVSATGHPIEVTGLDIFELDETTRRVSAIWAVADHAGVLASLDAGLPEVDIGLPVPARLAPATARDAGELLVLQRCCWVAEAVANDTLQIRALHESLRDVETWLAEWPTWCLRLGGRLIGAVRARQDARSWEIGRLMVAPDLGGRGIGQWLLRHAEQQAPRDAERISLFTGAGNTRNLSFYERAGYHRTAEPAPPRAVHFAKSITPS